MLLFFFQAEDGIRDKLVTGVQTCALPISSAAGRSNVSRAGSFKPTATTIRPSSSCAGWPMSRPGPSFTSSPRGSSPRPLDEPLRGTEHARPTRAATSFPHGHRRGCNGGSSDPLVPPLQVVERGTGGEARAIEAGRGELFAPQLLARQSDRDGEGTRHAVYQPQVRAPALRAVARGAGHRAARNRGCGPAHRGRWCDHVRGGRSEEHTSELQSLAYLVCRLLLEKKKTYYRHSAQIDDYQRTATRAD